MGNIREQKYIFVKSFLSKEELDILQPWCKQQSLTSIATDNQCPYSPSFYNDILLQNLLMSKKKKVEEISGLNLHETYVFWRAYIHGATLKDHSDRGSCEISVTVNIDSCGIKWPIHMNNNWITMDIGDAVMYLGCDLIHGRKTFEGVYCAQAFLHYVDADGLFSDFKGDKYVKNAKL
jgi:hypothetical protein